MPVIVPRASFRLLDDAAQRTLARLGLPAAAAERSEDDLLAQVRTAAPLGGTAEVAQVLLAPFEHGLDDARAALHEAGPGMAAAADKTLATVAAAVGRLAAKYERAWLHRDEEVRDQVRGLRRFLHPNGMPQERCYGLAYFAACAGDRELVARLVDAVEPFDSTTQDISVAA